MIERMVGAARLDPKVYEEVEADRSATRQAILVVTLVGVATGIGFWGAGEGLAGLVEGVVGGFFSWAVWASITYLIGTTMFRTPETEANWGQLVRTTGFAQSPGALRIFAFIPGIGPAILFAGFLWIFAAMVIAVRQALDYRSTWRAVGVVAVGFIFLALIQGAFGGQS